MRRYRSSGLLIVLLVVGAFLGGVLGQFFKEYLPFLVLGQTVGLSPFTLNLGILQITFGLSLHLTVAGAMGLIVGYLLYRLL
ncbi:MAG TPA: DUF4321 domain-containing protein [bacterium]|nr:DUF4321 domain-containing protein [bacterium]